METSSSRRFPVTVSHLPVVGCPICLGTVTYRSGGANEVPLATTPGRMSKRSASVPLARLRISVPASADLARS